MSEERTKEELLGSVKSAKEGDVCFGCLVKAVTTLRLKYDMTHRQIAEAADVSPRWLNRVIKQVVFVS